jgi:G3E family GTPase
VTGAVTSTMLATYVLTGFLGSGKTTLLNGLLRARPPGGGRFAVVVNELGEVGIDGALLPSGLSRQVELPNGCICCQLNDELDRTILELIDGTPDLELLILETTGVAEPAPITWTLEAESVRDKVRVAAVITVVDVLELIASRAHSPAVDAQIQDADVLVLSKLDLLPAGDAGRRQRAEVEAVVRRLNPRAPLVAGTPDEVIAELWRMIDDRTELAPRGGDDDRDDDHGDDHGDEHGHDHDDDHGHDRDRDRDHDDHGHDHAGQPGQAHGIDSVWVPIDGMLDLEELEDALEGLPPAFIRVKGIAHVIDASTGSREPHWVVFHRVGTRFSSERLPGPAPSRAVGLGHAIGREPLAACIAAAVLSSDR